MISLSEIETTSKRASRAAGFSWGIAEEVGKNMRLLELFGLSGVKNLNEYFRSYSRDNYKSIQAFSEKNDASSIPYCPIDLGVNFLDQITFIQKFKEIKFTNIAFPILFLPFLSRSSEVLGKRIFCKIDEKEFLFNFNQTIYSNYLKSEILKKCELINISFLENINTFSQDEWEEIYKLSENTFVEENESLKKDAAGAGLTDND
tara:strand:- start:691 stop:1302 length:612 start_codon:yes stop_codon:yes gene_type:complete